MSRLAAVTALALVAALGLLLAGVAGAEEIKLKGTVGPGFTITLTDASGARVGQLAPGDYELQVEDLSEEHNFHLRGPGVDVSTSVAGMGEQTFRFTLRDGTYTYLCDPHPTSMRGSFNVGSGSATTAPPPATTGSKPPAASAPVGATLVLTSGPGFTITLKTVAGKKVTTLGPGTYTFRVRDLSRAHNAHLTGAGVNRATGVRTTGTTTFRVPLRKGTLAFLCDPHRTSMRGTVKVG